MQSRLFIDSRNNMHPDTYWLPTAEVRVLRRMERRSDADSLTSDEFDLIVFVIV